MFNLLSFHNFFSRKLVGLLNKVRFLTNKSNFSWYTNLISALYMHNKMSFLAGSELLSVHTYLRRAHGTAHSIKTRGVVVVESKREQLEIASVMFSKNNARARMNGRVRDFCTALFLLGALW